MSSFMRFPICATYCTLSSPALRRALRAYYEPKTQRTSVFNSDKETWHSTRNAMSLYSIASIKLKYMVYFADVPRPRAGRKIAA